MSSGTVGCGAQPCLSMTPSQFLLSTLNGSIREMILGNGAKGVLLDDRKLQLE